MTLYSIGEDLNMRLTCCREAIEQALSTRDITGYHPPR